MRIGMKHKAASFLIIVLCIVAALGWGAYALSRMVRARQIIAHAPSDMILSRLKEGRFPYVKVLAAARRDRDKQVRLRAAWALGKTGEPAAIGPLVCALSDKYAPVQFTAQKGLVNIGPAALPALVRAFCRVNDLVDAGDAIAEAIAAIGDTSVTLRLIDIMRNGPPASKPHAAMALGYLRDRRSVGPLSEVLLDGPSAAAENAVTALGMLGDPRAVPALVKALASSRWPSIRGGAAEALGRIGDTAAIPALLHALDDANMNVARSAVGACKHIPDRRCIGPLLRIAEGGDARWRNLHDDIDTAVAISGALAYDTAARYLDNANEQVRGMAAVIMGMSGDARAGPRLIRALGDRAFPVRKAAMQALALRRDRAAVTRLIALLADADVYTRLSAVQALGKIGDPRAVRPLLVLLKSRQCNDSSFDAQSELQAVVFSLGELGDGAAAGPLRRILQDTIPSACRCHAAWALGKLHDRSAVGMLIALVQQPSTGLTAQDLMQWDLRACAADALGEIGDTVATPALIAALEDPKNRSPQAAINALGGLKDRRATSTLSKFLDDKQKSVRESAAAALAAITGKSSAHGLKTGEGNSGLQGAAFVPHAHAGSVIDR
jgi:HEAT repeat protein